MESKQKKAKTIEDVLVLYNETYITKDLALSILMQVDVRDALHFYIASYKEQKYEKIIEQMNGNLIWMLWTKRDMEVIFRPEWNVNTVLWETVDKPKWKVYYLWLRLYVLCMQYELMRMSYLIVLRKPDNWVRILSPDTTLNMFGFLEYPERKIIHFDIRKFYGYRNCVEDVQDGFFDKPLTDYNWFDYINDYFRPFAENILKLSVDERQRLPQKLVEFWGILGYINRLCTGQTDAVEEDAVLALFPRYGDNEKYITVANCVSCGEQASKKERTNPEMIFCDIECQTLFYRNKNFRK